MTAVVAGMVTMSEGQSLVGEMAHLGEKNTGIWDSQIWDPRYLVPLFLVKFSIEAFKFIR
jgi:hypothetical protein